MEIGYIISAVWLIICLVDLRIHNKKVEEMFPDQSDGRQNEKRRELTVSFYGFIFLLILLVGFFVKSIFS